MLLGDAGKETNQPTGGTNKHWMRFLIPLIDKVAEIDEVAAAAGCWQQIVKPISTAAVV